MDSDGHYFLFQILTPKFEVGNTIIHMAREYENVVNLRLQQLSSLKYNTLMYVNTDSYQESIQNGF